jgi:uncharacterized protein (DUF433 family)
MSEKISKSVLGAGIYLVSDISSLLKIPKHKVRRYLSLWDERMGQPFFADSFTWSVKKGVKAVSFLTLIELKTVFRLLELGMKPRAILKARENIARELRLAHPFASNNLLCDGRKLWVYIKNAWVDTDGSKQTNIVEFVELFAKEKLVFGSNGLVERYYPAGRSSKIVVNPHHQFGQPVIEGTNVMAASIYSMYQSGEQIDQICRLYDLQPEWVNEAIQFCKNAA